MSRGFLRNLENSCSFRRLVAVIVKQKPGAMENRPRPPIVSVLCDQVHQVATRGAAGGREDGTYFMTWRSVSAQPPLNTVWLNTMPGVLSREGCEQPSP